MELKKAQRLLKDLAEDPSLLKALIESSESVIKKLDYLDEEDSSELQKLNTVRITSSLHVELDPAFGQDTSNCGVGACGTDTSCGQGICATSTKNCGHAACHTDISEKFVEPDLTARFDTRLNIDIHFPSIKRSENHK